MSRAPPGVAATRNQGVQPGKQQASGAMHTIRILMRHSPYIQAKREYVEESTMTGFDPMTTICKFYKVHF